MIVLAGLQAAVAAEDGFQIHGQFRVAVPALEHLLYDATHEAGLTGMFVVLCFHISFFIRK